MSVVADSVNISGQSNAVQFKVPDCKLSDDLGALFDSAQFADVTLACNGREFQCHKVKSILLHVAEVGSYLADSLTLFSLRLFWCPGLVSSRPCSSTTWRRASTIGWRYRGESPPVQLFILPITLSICVR